jgi:GT2 family glycosyltransferase
MSVDLSISIANRDRSDLLRDCIESIRKSTHRISYEIIVVDNASSDGSAAMLRERFPEVTVIESSEPRGYGASHNQGYAASRGRYFLILNNDMVVHDGAFDVMHERISRDDSIGLIGCRLRNPDGTLQISCARESTVSRTIASDLMPGVGLMETLGLREWMSSWAHDEERAVDVVQGSCMMLPRALIEQIGLFDEQFEFFREEFDLCRRVRLAGKKVWFTPAGEITHFGGQTMKSYRAEAQQTYFESRYKYFRKHFGRGRASIAAASAMTGTMLRFEAWTIASLLPGARGKQARERARFFRGMARWFFGAARPWAS